MIYLFIAVFLLFLSFHYDVNRNIGGKERCYQLVFIILVCLAGLRYRIGIDSLNYNYSFYHETENIFNVFGTLSITEYPLWKLLNSIVYTIGGRFYMIQFIESAFVNFLVFAYIKKHSNYIFTCVFLYFIWIYPENNFEEMKQAFAVAISLYANDYMLEKKYLRGILLFTIACLFHFAAIIVALSSLLTFLKLDFKGILFLVAAFVVGGFIQNYYQDYLILFTSDEFLHDKLGNYFESEQFGIVSGKNVNYFIFRFLPLIFPLIAYKYLKGYGKNKELIRLEPFLVLAMLYFILGTRLVIMYRYNNFYTIYFILFISQAYVDYIRYDRKKYVVLIAIPLFVFYIWTTYVGYNGESDRYKKFYPYSSIIEKSVDSEREYVYSMHILGRLIPPNKDEY